MGKRQWFNCPPADIINRIEGKVNYGDGRKIDNRDLSMKFWRDHASYPFQSSRAVVPHREPALGA